MMKMQQFIPILTVYHSKLDVLFEDVIRNTISLQGLATKIQQVHHKKEDLYSIQVRTNIKHHLTLPLDLKTLISVGIVMDISHQTKQRSFFPCICTHWPLHQQSCFPIPLFAAAYATVSGMRVNRGAGDGLEIPISVKFIGHSKSIKWIAKKIN